MAVNRSGKETDFLVVTSGQALVGFACMLSAFLSSGPRTHALFREEPLPDPWPTQSGLSGSLQPGDLVTLAGDNQHILSSLAVVIGPRISL